MDNPTSICWLLGHPVSHSLSPLIHNTAFRFLNMPIRYEGLDVAPKEVGKTIAQIDGNRVLGANVTIPHKQAVLPFLDGLSDVAARVGAVNTIFVKDGKVTGHNTDVEGFLAPLQSVVVDATNIVVLGAGGATRAVLVGLSSKFTYSTIRLVSRNAQKAQSVCDELGCGQGASYDSLPSLMLEASLVVNTTPLGMMPDVQRSPIPDSLHFKPSQTVYDLIYTPSETQLLRKAKAEGATVIGGLPMLIAQAAASFHIWTGKKMPIEQVQSTLLEHLGNRTS